MKNSTSHFEDSDVNDLIEPIAQIRSIEDQAYREFRLRKLVRKAKVGGVSGLGAISRLHFEQAGGAA